jgi:hypothetical protein
VTIEKKERSVHLASKGKEGPRPTIPKRAFVLLPVQRGRRTVT